MSMTEIVFERKTNEKIIHTQQQHTIYEAMPKHGALSTLIREIALAFDKESRIASFAYMHPAQRRGPRSLGELINSSILSYL